MALPPKPKTDPNALQMIADTGKLRRSKLPDKKEATKENEKTSGRFDVLTTSGLPADKIKEADNEGKSDKKTIAGGKSNYAAAYAKAAAEAANISPEEEEKRALEAKELEKKEDALMAEARDILNEIGYLQNQIGLGQWDDDEIEGRIIELQQKLGGIPTHLQKI